MRAASLVAVLALTAVTEARADQVDSDERDADLRLVEARTQVELRDGLAYLQVRYEIANPARYADRARIALELPARARIIGLRQRLGSQWLDGRLLDAEAADERFMQYLEQPFVAARGAALASGALGHLDLTVSFVPPRGRVGLAYQAAMPACYHGGRWYAAMPTDATPLAIVGGSLHQQGKRGYLANEILDACELSDDTAVASWPGPPTGVVARAGTITVAGAELRAVEFVVGRELAPRPHAPSVVFVVDASRSVGVDGLADQLAVIRGYLAHAPDARVEVVLARRHASRLFGRFVPAAQALARLPTLTAPSSLGNGSNLDGGVALAAALLAGAAGPRRLVAFTDDRLRPTWDDADLSGALASLPADAVAHVVVPGGDQTELLIDREHHLAAPIAPWGGIVAGADVDTSRAALLELVRPIRVDLQRSDDSEMESLFEGDGLRLVERTPAALPRAWIWGRPLPITPRTGAAAEARLALLSLTAIQDLSPDEERALGHLGHAVTGETSLLADRPSWQPGGLPPDDVPVTGRSYSSSCGPMSFVGGSHHTYSTARTAGTRPELPELQSLLAGPVAGCAATLAPDTWTVSLDVATTGVEIVDVEVTATVSGDGAAQTRLAACVTEATWATELPAAFAPWTRSFTARYDR